MLSAAPHPEAVQSETRSSEQARLRVGRSRVAVAFDGAQLRALAELTAAPGGPHERLQRVHLEIAHGTIRLAAYDRCTFAAIWLAFDARLASRRAVVPLPADAQAWARPAHAERDERWSVVLGSHSDGRIEHVELRREAKRHARWDYDASLSLEPLARLALADARRRLLAHRQSLTRSAVARDARPVIERAARALGCETLGARLSVEPLELLAGARACSFELRGASPGPHAPTTPERGSTRAEPPPLLMQGWSLDAAGLLDAPGG